MEIEGFQLSPQQEALWILQKDTAYAQCIVVIRRELSVPILYEVIRQVISRHEILHTCFRRVPGIRVPVQVIGENTVPSWQHIDLSKLVSKDQEQKIEEVARKDQSMPFDVERGPLLRVSLLTTSLQTHILVLTLSSLCADGRTLSHLVKEIQLCYEVYPEQKSLNEVTQYVQFSEWLRELQEEENVLVSAYWNRQEAARASRVVLPYEKSLAIATTFEPASITLSQSAEKVRLIAEQFHVSLSTVLLACWYVLLWRITGQSDITLDIVLDGRKYEELQDTLGLFSQTIPLCFSFTDDLSFAEVMTQLHHLRDDLSSGQEYYISAPQADSQLEKGAVISFEFDDFSSFFQGGEAPFYIERKYTWFHRFRINLQVLLRNEELFFQFSYDPSTFNIVDIECLAEQFSTLLTSALHAPKNSASELTLVGNTERSYLLGALNNTSTDYPKQVCFHHLFEATVEQSPEAVALVFADKRMTYYELNCRANQLAYALQSGGVRADTLVGVYVERGPEMLIALLAILKAGGAFVPLDRSYPKSRLEFIRQDALFATIVTQERLASEILAYGVETCYLDAAQPCDYSQYEKNPVSGVCAENMAYVLYTSGSTGRPKGTMIPHRGLVNYVQWAVETYAVSQGNGAPVHTPIGFDLTITSLFVPLLAGRSVIFLPEGLDLEELSRALSVQQNLSFVKLTPAHLEALSYLSSPAENNQWARVLIVGGEVLKEQSLSFWRTHLPHVRIFNEYGPTETVVGCCVYEISSASLQNGIVPIGSPIANTQLYILNSHLQPVAIGTVGEIYIGGAGLARGYLLHPDLTAEKFLPNPFAAVPGERLYKTGDLARWRPEGIVEFLGRVDSQVKIRGYRIELGEIENVLREHPVVKDAAVIALNDTSTHKSLRAYLVYHKEALIHESDVHTFLKSRLPDYMLPDTFVQIPTLPLTLNGKVDYQALAHLNSGKASSGKPFVLPRTEVEKVLAEVCCQLLHIEQIGIHDNFFAKGGDSILGIQLVARVRQAGFYLTPKQLFEYQTIADLAIVATMTTAVEAEQHTIVGPVPLTPIQHWFFGMRLLNPHHWNQAIMLEVQPSVDQTKLELAFQQMFLHHDALRLSFTPNEQTWSQFNSDRSDSLVISSVNLSLVPQAEQASALEAVAAESQRTLDLSKGPLLRVILFYLGEQKPYRLLLIAHHLIVDGVSWRILLEDLQRAYAQIEAGTSSELPAKTTSYKYWAEKLGDYVRSTSLRQQLSYWLDDARRSVSSLPYDYDKGANTEASTSTVAVELTHEETQALLREVPVAYHTEINDVLLAAVLIACMPWTGQSKLLIDLEGHGREDLFEDVDLSRTVGWFTTIFPVLLETSPGATILETLKRVKETLRQIPQHGIGYGLLHYLTEDPVIKQAIRALPQADLSFNYFGQIDQVLSDSPFFGLAQEDSGRSRDAANIRVTLLDVTAIVEAGKLHVMWTYSENKHDRTTIETLAARYIQALRAFLDQSAFASAYVPSDFALARLEPSVLDRLSNEPGNIEDIYPLSPAQQEMLHYSVTVPQAWAYFNQLTCTFRGLLNISAFQEACQQTLERHPVLRTSFIWEGLAEALQVVHRRVRLPLEQQDWRGIPLEKQRNRWIRYKEEDRVRGFDLAVAPLVKLTLIRMSDETYRFIWSHHHLLMDGWCTSLILNEVFTNYHALCNSQTRTAEAARPYRDYIAWLRQQNTFQSEAFWRRALRGIRQPTLLATLIPQTAIPEEQLYAEQRMQLSLEITEGIRMLALQHHLTVNTIFQGAWALVLCQLTDCKDILFGVTIADRPADLHGIESRVGLFINTVPMRVQVPSQTPLVPWLKQLQDQQVELRQYTYNSLLQIQRWSEISPDQALFQCLIRFQNYPKNFAFNEQKGSLEIDDICSIDRWHYPLCLIANLDEVLHLEISYRRDYFTESVIDQIFAQLQKVLINIASSAEERIATLLSRCSLQLPEREKDHGKTQS